MIISTTLTALAALVGIYILLAMGLTLHDFLRDARAEISKERAKTPPSTPLGNRPDIVAARENKTREEKRP